jgi:hypothetical protein
LNNSQSRTTGTGQLVDTVTKVKFGKAGASFVAIASGAFAVLSLLTQVKPDEGVANVTGWLQRARAFAVNVLPHWVTAHVAIGGGAAAVAICLAAWLFWPWLGSYGPFLLWQATRANRKRTRYLSAAETPLGHAMLAMSLRSAWARWYSAQHLANSGTPIEDHSLMHMIANTMVLNELVEGTLTVMGRLPGEFQALPIPKHYWQYRCFAVERDQATIWKISLRDRHGVPKAREQNLPQYEDLLVNSEAFERLFPMRDAVTDAARKRLLKQAKQKNLPRAEIDRLA